MDMMEQQTPSLRDMSPPVPGGCLLCPSGQSHVCTSTSAVSETALSVSEQILLCLQSICALWPGMMRSAGVMRCNQLPALFA